MLFLLMAKEKRNNTERGGRNDVGEGKERSKWSVNRVEGNGRRGRAGH